MITPCYATLFVAMGVLSKSEPPTKTRGAPHMKKHLDSQVAVFLVFGVKWMGKTATCLFGQGLIHRGWSAAGQIFSGFRGPPLRTAALKPTR